MKPTIYTGDLIIIQSESDNNVGDVITFNTGQEAVPITHRIIEKNDNIYTTKGDFNSFADLNKVKRSGIVNIYSESHY
jgi:signal peptidase I